jgi:hypothetical protein
MLTTHTTSLRVMVLWWPLLTRALTRRILILLEAYFLAPTFQLKALMVALILMVMERAWLDSLLGMVMARRMAS